MSCMRDLPDPLQLLSHPTQTGSFWSWPRLGYYSMLGRQLCKKAVNIFRPAWSPTWEEQVDLSRAM